MFSRAGTTYCYEDADFRKKLYSPLKTTGFVPEKDSEIYVTGLPSHASLHDLLVFFEPVGELFQIKLMTKKDGVQNRGFAYVTYMNKQLAQNALHILANKRFMNSKTLTMHLSIDNCRLFLGGIPIEKSKTAIWQELMNAYGVKNIVDVITYRNYANPTHNRGFVFLEFRTHEEASYFRAKYWDKLYLFGRQVLVDWAIPNNFQFNDTKVKILFVRNLDVTQKSEEFAQQIFQFMDRRYIEKIYKFKDYAYIHMVTRADAENLMDQLKKFFQNTNIEVTFAKPPNKFTDRNFRDKALVRRRSTGRRSSTSSQGSTSGVSSGSPFQMTANNDADLWDEVSKANRRCLAMEKTIKNLLSHSIFGQDYGPPMSSNTKRPSPNFTSPNYAPMNIRPETPVIPTHQTSYLNHYQIATPVVRPVNRVAGHGHGMHLPQAAPLHHSNYTQNAFDFEDMVNNLLNDC